MGIIPPDPVCIGALGTDSRAQRFVDPMVSLVLQVVSELRCGWSPVQRAGKSDTSFQSPTLAPVVCVDRSAAHCSWFACKPY